MPESDAAAPAETDASAPAAPATPAAWPAVAFVNRLSGGQLGSKVFDACKACKALASVHDLSSGGPRDALEALARDAATAAGCLLICFGGDGTFNWIASTVLAIRASSFPRFKPDLVPVPLGTGNDLARVLGWGTTFPGFSAVPKVVGAAKAAPRAPQLDLFSLRFAHASGAAKMKSFQNYFSVGCDAEVARRFDAARSANPGRFTSQARNKAAYAALGASLALRGSVSLSKRVASLTVDGVRVVVPHSTKSLVCLSIPSFGAGTNPWGLDKADMGCAAPLVAAHSHRSFEHPCVDDGLIEVVALSGVLSTALMHNPVGLNRLRGYGAARLAQGAVVQITFLSEDAFRAANPHKEGRPGVAEAEAEVKRVAAEKGKKKSGGESAAAAAAAAAAAPAGGAHRDGDSSPPPPRALLAAQADGEAWAFPGWGETIGVRSLGRVGCPTGPHHVHDGGWPHARFSEVKTRRLLARVKSERDGAATNGEGEEEEEDRGATPEGVNHEPTM